MVDLFIPAAAARSQSYLRTMFGNFMHEDFPELMAGLHGRGTGASQFEPTPLVFAAGQPNGLHDAPGVVPYRGQDAAKRRLTLYIRALKAGERIKALFTGPAGTGKTTLARIVCSMLHERQAEWGVGPGEYFELLPAQVSTKERLDEFMTRVVVDPYAVVFIDEVHTLTNLEALFHVLHDTGAARYPLESGAWIDVPATISWMAATTDPGELDRTTGGAMRRRLEPEYRLEAPSREVLASIVSDQGRVDALPVQDEAARAIAQRSVFPWQAKAIYHEAKLVATVDEAEGLHPAHAQEAFEIMELDERGLLREDRDVIRSLFMAPYELASRPGVIRYRMSEEAVCSAAGVDRGTYKKRVQPKLIRLGLLTTVGGQSLTPRAVEWYKHLKDPT
jgi:Holliday junction resolvasome RuvABC ATP-dependent DNA helicase subunit